VAKIFGQRRWLAVTCLTMEDALKEIKALKVDLIITDIFMPGIGGIEGIPFLKSKAPDIPIIAMSGGWDKLLPEEAVKAAVKVGARGGLAKPIKGDQLDAMLKDLGLGGSDMGEPNWPQTANETTDWEQVFEAPTNGRIAWNSNADTFDVLKISAINMVDHLFQNIRTKLDAKKYRERLVDILNQGTSLNQEQTLTAILSLLSEVKTKFKQEDARYIAERRLENFEKRKDKRRAAPALVQAKPWYEKFALPLAGAGLVFVIGVMMVLLGGEDEVAVKKEDKKITQTERSLQTRTKMGTSAQSTRGQLKEAKQDSSKLFREADKKAQALESAVTKVHQAQGRRSRPACGVLALGAVEWSSSPYRLPPITVRMTPLMVVKDYESMPIVCDRAPTYMDMINTALAKLPDDGDAPTKDEIKKVALPLASFINVELGLELVKKVSFVSGDDLRKMKFINDDCRPLEPKEIRDLSLITLEDRFTKPQP